MLALAFYLRTFLIVTNWRNRSKKLKRNPKREPQRQPYTVNHLPEMGKLGHAQTYKKREFG
jgi:hypothetical protein